MSGRISDGTSAVFLVSSTLSACSSFSPRIKFAAGRRNYVDFSAMQANTLVKEETEPMFR